MQLTCVSHRFHVQVSCIKHSKSTMEAYCSLFAFWKRTDCSEYMRSCFLKRACEGTVGSQQASKEVYNVLLLDHLLQQLVALAHLHHTRCLSSMLLTLLSVSNTVDH